MLKSLLYENSKKSKPTNGKKPRNLNNHIHIVKCIILLHGL